MPDESCDLTGETDGQRGHRPRSRHRKPTDAIIKITSTNLCRSDLHLYETLTRFMGQGDVMGHEPMGIVEEVGAEVTAIEPGDRVVTPF